MVNQERSLRLIGSLIVFLAAFILMFAVASISANAQDSTGDTPTSSEDPRPTKEELMERRQKLQEEREKRMADRKLQAEERRAEAMLRLEDKKLEACKKRESSINRAMDRIANRVDKQKDVFNKISERVQTFYDEKGYALEGYDALVEDVNAKKATVETAVADLKESDVDFKCDSEDPLGVAETFKGAREEVVIAMKEYKTSIKDLIVGVKSAASTAAEGEGGEE